MTKIDVGPYYEAKDGRDDTYYYNWQIWVHSEVEQGDCIDFYHFRKSNHLNAYLSLICYFEVL